MCLRRIETMNESPPPVSVPVCNTTQVKLRMLAAPDVAGVVRMLSCHVAELVGGKVIPCGNAIPIVAWTEGCACMTTRILLCPSAKRLLCSLLSCITL